VSALFGADPQTGRIPDDARAEAVQMFANLEAILAAAGARLTDVVRVGIFMKELQRDRPTLNEVWAERFGDHRPARCAVQAGDFGRPRETVRYMMEVVAHPEGTLSPDGADVSRAANGCVGRRGGSGLRTLNRAIGLVVMRATSVSNSSPS
jgi:2-iminobutanoate/2-iminopropanoate deaminase